MPRRRRVALFMETGGDEVGRALAARGWQVGATSPGPDSSVALSELTARLLVLEVRDAADDAPLLLAERYRRAGGAADLAFLARSASEAQRRWGGQLSPYWYAWPMAAESLAAFLDHLGTTTAAPRASRDPEAAVTLTIRLWEGVEVDGREVYLGTAERNFLFTLASREGTRLSKLDDVEVGAGRTVPAAECRRRLGRRLGPELAELLVPVLRGEPYRFRGPAEVDAVCHAEPWRVSTRLRLIGRGSVRAFGTPRIEAHA